MKINDVVQFNENHKWRGSLGIINKIKPCGDGTKTVVKHSKGDMQDPVKGFLWYVQN